MQRRPEKILDKSSPIYYYDDISNDYYYLKRGGDILAALKYSRQRESIKEFLMSRKDHPTADMVYENMKNIYPNISLGTVYRNLSLLADIGEIQKLASYGGADRFDARTDEHCHFMCTECGRVSDLESEGFDRLLKQAEDNFHGRITGCSIRFFGICEDCIKNKKSGNLT